MWAIASREERWSARRRPRGLVVVESEQEREPVARVDSWQGTRPKSGRVDEALSGLRSPSPRAPDERNRWRRPCRCVAPIPATVGVNAET